MNNNQQTGTTIQAKVKLHRYRFPETKHESGAYAIVVLDVIEPVDGCAIDEGTLDREGRMILTGRMPRLDKDTEYTVQARLVKNPKYGYQYECENITLGYDMSKREDQEKFFSYFLTENQIASLFSSFEDPAAVLKAKDADALMGVKGIGPTTASRMIEKFSSNIGNGRAYVALKEYDLTKHAIDKLVEQFGSADAVVDIIKSNPYSLIKLARGYGWKKADAIALKQGFTRDCKERCMAYAQYCLEDYADKDGNSCMPIGTLVDAVCQECRPVLMDNAKAWLKEDMVGEDGFEEFYAKRMAGERAEKTPTFFYSRSRKMVGLLYYRLLEREIVDNLKRIKSAKSDFQYDKETCEKIILKVEEEQGYAYTHEQRSAIWKALNNNISILTGCGGTGKSSTLKPFIRILEHYGKKAEQCALSGRAANLLTEYTGLMGKTIHRLLRYIPDKEMFACNEHNPIPADVIILDESSMVGEELFLSLLKAIRSGAKLLMLGDIKQLPPLSVGNILSDTLRSGYIPTTVLTVIQRQARLSGIITESAAVSEGHSIVKGDFSGEEVRGALRDFKIVCSFDPAVVHYKAVEEYKRLFIDQHIPADDIQIVVPQRTRGINSCRQFNAELQEIVNGKLSKSAVTVEVRDKDQFFHVTYKPGDRVMITRNNYHTMTTEGEETAVFNGNMGHITKIDENSMIINLEGVGKIILDRKAWDGVTHAWTCTCHKLQGSQCKHAIVVVDKGSFVMLSREWLYTALTRSRKDCVLVGQPAALNMATRTSSIKIKQTWLGDDLREAFMAEHGKGNEDGDLSDK